MNLLTASIVLYKNDPQMVTRVIESFFDGYTEEKGPRRLLYLIDNSPNDELKKLQTINPNNIVYSLNNYIWISKKLSFIKTATKL